MKMLANNILVDPARHTEEMKGSIVIPGTVRTKFARGQVVAVGCGLWLSNGTQVPIDVKAGQWVLYYKEGAAEIEVDDRTMHIVQERQLLAILEDGEFVAMHTTPVVKGETDASD